MADLLRSLAARARGESPSARPKVGTRFGATPKLPGDWSVPEEPETRSTRISEAKLVESVQQLGNKKL